MTTETLAQRMPCALLLCNRAACSSALGNHADALADADAALAADPTYVKASSSRARSRGAGPNKEAASVRGDPRGASGGPGVADGVNRCVRATGGRPTNARVRYTSRRGAIQRLKAAAAVRGGLYGSWCGPCRQIAPVFERMALANPSVHFLKVDVDRCRTWRRRRTRQSFKLYRYGSKLEEFSGADASRLQAWLTRCPWREESSCLQF